MDISNDTKVQRACRNCSSGELTTRNPHLWGECNCECHNATPAYVSRAESFTGPIYNYEMKGQIPEVLTINGKQFVVIK